MKEGSEYKTIDPQAADPDICGDEKTSVMEINWICVAKKHRMGHHYYTNKYPKELNATQAS